MYLAPDSAGLNNSSDFLYCLNNDKIANAISYGAFILSNKPMPLSRFKVIDLTRARAGPTSVRQLADWGADVIRVELPPALGTEIMGADRHGYEAQNLHRNKRSLTLNLKKYEGRKIFF